MKRTILSILAMLLLTAGALVAQSSNTSAPGPTQQREPSETNNNLPNPGNPQTDVQTNRETLQEQGTVQGTASESIDRTDSADTTDTMDTGTTGTTDTTTGTGTTGGSTSYGTTGSTGSMDTTATDTDTMNQTDTTTTGAYDQSGTGGDMDTLPGTASPLPLAGLVGLLAMAAAVALRARRA